MNNITKKLSSTDSPQDFVDYIADSSCTEHYVPEKVQMTNETQTKNIYITLPNGYSLKSITSRNLNIEELSKNATNAYKFSNFKKTLSQSDNYVMTDSQQF